MSISAVARISSSCRSVCGSAWHRAERPPGVADGVLGAAGVERRLGGLVEGVHGVTGERAGHPGHPAELGDQLGRRGGVVGEVLDLVEVLALLGGERHRHAGVSLGARALGEGLVGDLAHDVAAEAPPAAVELEDPVGRQLERRRRGRTPGSSPSANSSRAIVDPLGPSTAALSTTARRGGGSWSRRAAMSARNEPGRFDCDGA